MAKPSHQTHKSSSKETGSTTMEEYPSGENNPASEENPKRWDRPDKEVEVDPLDGPELQTIPLAQRSSFYSTWNNATTPFQATIGNMLTQVPIGTPALETNSNVSTLQASKIAWSGFAQVLIPPVSPVPKNWRLKKGIDQRRKIPPTIVTFHAGNAYTVAFALNGMSYELSPGEAITLTTQHALNQMQMITACWTRNSLNYTTTAPLTPSVSTITGPLATPTPTNVTASAAMAGATYAWTKVSGTPVVTFTTPTVVSPTVTANVAGTTVIRLTATLPNGVSTTLDLTYNPT